MKKPQISTVAADDRKSSDMKFGSEEVKKKKKWGKKRFHKDAMVLTKHSEAEDTH